MKSHLKFYLSILFDAKKYAEMTYVFIKLDTLKSIKRIMWSLCNVNGMENILEKVPNCRSG